uniref:J domain-containing protein n=1 Tax=Anopheles maculatus TaxID=74869 RepID=A0A182SAT6_9DIPT
MSTITLDKCEKYFGTKNIYKLFSVEKTATIHDVLKPFYRLLLQHHPDAASESEKPEAVDKMKVLKTLYNILGNPESRAEYDKNGFIDRELEIAVNQAVEGQMFCKPTTAEDIDTYRECYIGSRKERSDIKQEYLKGKGCMNHMIHKLHFMPCEDEPRLIAIVQEMIDTKEVPEYAAFTKEPKEKRARRHARYGREAALAQNMLKEQRRGLDPAAYEQKIAAERKDAFIAMIDSMEAKYRDNQEEIEI